MKKLLLLPVAYVWIMLLGNAIVFAGEKSIAISDENISPTVHSSAALLLESSSRGFIFPRMTYENMLAIRNPEDGLIVYVLPIDDDPTKPNKEQGYWYFDKMGTDDAEDDIWRRLRDVDTDYNITEPIGTIVAYHGDLSLFDADGVGIRGTEAFGWEICDGETSNAKGVVVPDLSGRFIVGAKTKSSTLDGYEETYSDYDPSGDTPTKECNGCKVLAGYESIGSSANGGGAKFYVTENQIPKHSHLPDDIKAINVTHSHPNFRLDHNHEIRTASGRWSGDETCPRPTSGRGYMTIETMDLNSNESVTFEPFQMKVRVTIPANCVIPHGKSGSGASFQGEKLNNLPPHYKMVFIIKVQ